MASILELVPRVKGQGDWTWDQIKPVLSNPNNSTFDSIFRVITGKISSYGEDRDIQRRQAIWIFCVLLFHEGWDDSANRERVLGVVHQWEIDKAVFYDMKDTAETYKLLKQTHVEDWDTKRIEELKRSKKDLDKSIKYLIELG